MKGKVTLKAAILGTEDYHTTMREILDTSLPRVLSYVPQQMKPDNSLPPVYPDYMVRVDPIMQALASDDQLADCNRRSPYLVLTWLLIGSDNEYRICQYMNDVRAAKQVAMTHLRLALGDMPLDREIQDAVRVAANARFARTASDAARLAFSAIPYIAKIAMDISFAWMDEVTGFDSSVEAAMLAAWAAGAVAGAAGNVVVFGVGKKAARAVISAKARQWAYISDEEALQIARQLTFDILSL